MLHHTLSDASKKRDGLGGIALPGKTAVTSVSILAIPQPQIKTLLFGVIQHQGSAHTNSCKAPADQRKGASPEKAKRALSAFAPHLIETVLPSPGNELCARVPRADFASYFEAHSVIFGE